MHGAAQQPAAVRCKAVEMCCDTLTPGRGCALVTSKPSRPPSRRPALFFRSCALKICGRTDLPPDPPALLHALFTPTISLVHLDSPRPARIKT